MNWSGLSRTRLYPWISSHGNHWRSRPLIFSVPLTHHRHTPCVYCVYVYYIYIYPDRRAREKRSPPEKVYSRAKKVSRLARDTKLFETWNCPRLFRDDLVIKRAMHLLAQYPDISSRWPDRGGVVPVDKDPLQDRARFSATSAQRRNDWMEGQWRRCISLRRLSHVWDTRPRAHSELRRE